MSKSNPVHVRIPSTTLRAISALAGEDSRMVVVRGITRILIAAREIPAALERIEAAGYTAAKGYSIRHAGNRITIARFI